MRARDKPDGDVRGADVALLILAGGTSRRWGGVDKTAALLAGRPVVLHVLDGARSALPDDAPVVIVAPADHPAADLLAESVDERRPRVAWVMESPAGGGPAAGLAAGLRALPPPTPSPELSPEPSYRHDRRTVDNLTHSKGQDADLAAIMDAGATPEPAASPKPSAERSQQPSPEPSYRRDRRTVDNLTHSRGQDADLAAIMDVGATLEPAASPRHDRRTVDNLTHSKGQDADLAAIMDVGAAIVVVLAGDLPFAGTAVGRLLTALAGASPGVDAAVAVDPDGRRQPLLAAYKRAPLATALGATAADLHGRALRDVLAGLSVLAVPVSHQEAFDLDVPGALGLAQGWLPPAH